MSLFGSYNHVVIMGNMTRDPEIRTIPSGKRVANITVAVNESVKRGDRWEDEATFVEVTVWEKTAELVERFGGKGKPILIEGRLRQEKWQDKATGENRSKMVVVASGVTFMSGDGARGGGGGGGGNYDRQQSGGGRGASGGGAGGGGGYQGGSRGGSRGAPPAGGRGAPTGGTPYAQDLDGDPNAYAPLSGGDYEGGYQGGGDFGGEDDTPF